MKAFYKIEDGKLSTGSGSIIPEGFIEYTIGKEPSELLEVLILDISINNASMINAKAGEIITNKYPLYKQNNITLLLTPYTEIDKEQMGMFIETVRSIAKQAKDNNTHFEDIDWVNLDK